MPFANVVVKKYLKPVDRFVDLHVGCPACFESMSLNILNAVILWFSKLSSSQF